MQNSADDKLTEIIIGEAVKELLNSNAAVSWRALLDKLHCTLDAETDENRIRACLMAIDEVRNEIALNPRRMSDNAAGPERNKMH